MSEPVFKRVLVIKLRHHGDVLLSAPVFSALAASQPGVEVDALVYHDTREMLSLHPHVSQIHTIGRDWRKLGPLAQLKHYWRLYRTLKSRHYDLIVHLTDHWHGARLAKLLKPRVSVAPVGTKNSVRANRVWNRSFSALFPILPGNRRHTIEMHLDALRRIGIQPTDKTLRFVAGAEAEASVAAKLAAHGQAAKGYVLVHPTSRWMFKAWPVEKMAELINTLIARGEHIVLSAAPSTEERAWIASLTPLLRGAYADLTGQLTLKELGALIAGAKVLIGVDSVPMHLAGAVQTPVVALFGPSGDIEWAPWQVPHRIVTAQFSCRPCGRAGCGDSRISDCLTTIPVSQVLAAFDALLDEVKR
ncbi:putative lipopolysaccharide heptosyltransferase III [Jeongeupia sp. HS-3]|uniref:putative lipopolysaccharide heptosyltransferase III n=1 Tax=Jeongeupia sp. HS-3 TaxID=1009682 RepID=UPI0018A37701|nr:putative lipopolysaccharide heptosyltransferase III [Jeongeupia sp. HS-3]BCL76898.1 putative lipopolysaccharide heptosyltransferase III [Jeongeupia sp. HS-3]